MPRIMCRMKRRVILERGIKRWKWCVQQFDYEMVGTWDGSWKRK